MRSRYSIRFVGNDSLEHRMIVWAASSHDAKAEAKRRGAEFVMSVKPANFAWLWALLGVAAVVALMVGVS